MVGFYAPVLIHLEHFLDQALVRNSYWPKAARLL